MILNDLKLALEALEACQKALNHVPNVFRNATFEYLPIAGEHATSNNILATLKN